MTEARPIGSTSRDAPLPPATATRASAPSASRKSQPFWLGGVASMGAACCSHPLDLLKVRQQLQTSPCGRAASSGSTTAGAAAPAAAPTQPRQGMIRLAANIIRTEGVLSLYCGLSASLMRQATYSTVRFGTYESLKRRRLDQLEAASPDPHAPHPPDLPMLESIAYSLVGGALGGVAGNPADLCNVRMQNDRQLPASQRRNYRNVFHALSCVSRNEGVASLWNGVGPNVARGMLMTAGQLASYDVAKGILVRRFGCSDKHVSTHLTASCLAGVVATILTQPVDVLKTRTMNSARKAAAASAGTGASTGAAGTAAAPPVGALALARRMVATEGIGSLYKGFIPALTRLGPHTVATFLILEQLKRITA